LGKGGGRWREGIYPLRKRGGNRGEFLPEAGVDSISCISTVVLGGGKGGTKRGKWKDAPNTWVEQENQIQREVKNKRQRFFHVKTLGRGKRKTGPVMFKRPKEKNGQDTRVSE